MDTVIHSIVVLDAPTSCWSILGVIGTFLAVLTAIFTTIYFEFKRRHEDIHLSVRMMSFANVKPVREYVELTITNMSPIRFSIIEEINWIIDGDEYETLSLVGRDDIVTEDGNELRSSFKGFKLAELTPLKRLVLLVIPWSDNSFSSASKMRIVVRTGGEKVVWDQHIPFWHHWHKRFRWSINLTPDQKRRAFTNK